MPALPRTVRRLGLVSLLTDASSEMIYPLLPSLLPGLPSVLVLVFAVQEVPSATALASAPPTAVETPGTKPAPRGLGRLLAVIGLFTLGNSSDAFLLLRAQDAGVALPLVPILWTAHHVVKSTASTAGGALFDPVGPRPAIPPGWVLYAPPPPGPGLAPPPAPGRPAPRGRAGPGTGRGRWVLLPPVAAGAQARAMAPRRRACPRPERARGTSPSLPRSPAAAAAAASRRSGSAPGSGIR